MSTKFISNNGNSIQSYREIEYEVLNYFSTSYQKLPGQRTIPSNINWVRVSDSQNSASVAPFCGDETKMALKALEKNKALGADGFTMEFFSFSAGLVKHFDEFHNNGRAMGFRGILIF